LLIVIDADLATQAAMIRREGVAPSLISDSTLFRFDMWLAECWKLALAAIRKEEMIQALHAGLAAVLPGSRTNH
jgi:hypothetical protein